MPEPVRISEEYMKHSISVRSGRAQNRSGIAAVVTITSEAGTPVSQFTEFVDSVHQLQGSTHWSTDDQVCATQVAERALHRARGALLTGRLEECHGRDFLFDPDSENAIRSDEYLRRVLYRTFKRAFDINPWHSGYVHFDEIGVALIEDVSVQRVATLLARLEHSGHIESGIFGIEPGARPYRITASGLDEADRVQFPERAPWNLVEENLANVDSFLGQHAPELVQQLRRQAARVAAAQSLSEHEVGEVAQACEQVLWDFFDIPALWTGISENRPPKDKVRDRLRILLSKKVPSNTEAEFLEGLNEYIVGWFGPLEQFVHKHRHLPGKSERSQARRCVLYTYLFLADTVEILALR